MLDSAMIQGRFCCHFFIKRYINKGFGLSPSDWAF